MTNEYEQQVHLTNVFMFISAGRLVWFDVVTEKDGLLI